MWVFWNMSEHKMVWPLGEFAGRSSPGKIEHRFESFPAWLFNPSQIHWLIPRLTDWWAHTIASVGLLLMFFLVGIVQYTPKYTRPENSKDLYFYRGGHTLWSSANQIYMISSTEKLLTLLILMEAIVICFHRTICSIEVKAFFFTCLCLLVRVGLLQIDSL